MLEEERSLKSFRNDAISHVLLLLIQRTNAFCQLLVLSSACYNNQSNSVNSVDRSRQQDYDLRDE